MHIVIPFSGGGKPRLNKVKASSGCHRFSEEIYRAKLDKIWMQIRQGAFDQKFNNRRVRSRHYVVYFLYFSSCLLGSSKSLLQKRFRQQ
ncbi:hypothetical protein [Siminovitchia terrae]|uniref:hypothetical protein n=1 Tax=Siminovitchia terrae TaxID=1914933 RepID=UPI001BB3E6D9|nr:hypothetical protein [Siminovitchia terrae]